MKYRYWFIFLWIVLGGLSCRNQLLNTSLATTSETENWGADGNGGQQKFAALTQINTTNVAKLQPIWTFHTGNTSGNVQLNPLVINGVVYITNPSQHLIAVDGKSGQEKWRFNPARKGEQAGGINRGLGFWSSEDEQCIFYTSGHFLYAVNVKDGSPFASFGDKGRVDLRQGLNKPADQIGIGSPAAPVVFKDWVIVGTMSWSSPAFVAAYEIKTGKRAWIFNTIPSPKEEGYDTWGDRSFWETGAGVNVWGGMVVDAKNQLLYFATGQPKDDFFRPNNKGKQLFGNSVVALDARSGKLKWYYQYIHHDIWDLDLPCAPILVDLKIKGKKIPGLAQLTKTGNTLLFNRISGQLLSDVEERSVPESKLIGENAYPTQPFIKWPEPFAKQVVTASDLSTLTPAATEFARNTFMNADTGWFTPPSEKGVIYYGIHGGAEWGGGSYDASRNMLYVNSNELAWHITMRDIHQKEGDIKQHGGRKLYLANSCQTCHGPNLEGLGAPSLTDISEKYTQAEIAAIIKKGKRNMPAFTFLPEDDLQLLAAYLKNVTTDEIEKTKVAKGPVFRALAYTKFLDQEGYPATAPPWGTMNAIDLSTGKIKWKVPIGEYEALKKKGIEKTGTENFGGSIVTAGGLVFIAATRDEKFRALDAETGETLWEVKLPFGGYAIPATYMVDGKQYVIIAAAGGGKLGTTTGDAYVTFALPN